MNQGPQIRDIHLPPEISWWPPAIGWWLLLALGIVLLAVAAYFIQRYLKKRLLSRALDKQLQQINDTAKLLAACNRLLKSYALQSSTDNHCVEKLHGQAWLDYLNQQQPINSFVCHSTQQLALGPYQAQPEEIEHKQLIKQTLAWLWRRL